MPKTKRIGLMLDLDWPFERHLSVFAGTQRYAQEVGRWECVVNEAIPETLRKARQPVYDGVIARATRELADAAKRRGLPVVNTWFDSPARELPLVSPDFEAVGRMAAEHLLTIGLRRFVVLAVKGHRAEEAQARAFAETVRDGGGTCEAIAAPRSYTSRADIRRRFHQTLPPALATWRPPIGVYIATPGMLGRHIAHEARQQGLRIPEDVAIIAGINEAMLCNHPAPSLTSIEASYEEVGYQAARLLDEWMRGARPQSCSIAPRRVIARQSTDFMAVADPLVSASLQYLAAHVHKPIRVADIARAVHTSRRTLERRFQAALGRTIASEIRRLRIERAKRYLLDTSQPIKSIARLTGFSSKERLYEAFRAAGEKTPTAAARKLRQR
jgi:LacI family transcriptional regulator